MKKLLNNIWAVAGLAALGSLLVVARLVLPLLGGNDDPLDYSDEEDDWLVDETELEVERMALTSVDASEITWIVAPYRDPFAKQQTLKQTDLHSVQEQLAKTTRHQPRLDALVSGSYAKLAVIDGQIVAEGDQVSGYRVAQIGSSNVRLRDPLTEQITDIAVTDHD